ncbi:Uma2 family endonuclease [Candidatus Cyanaurora vandensis]|uniref:Uma2 family endonuclease n=1 Tax=Candidatus Cyanaurora vandensis TaxID=2714958 RepID=UPI002579991A|nr:Uma2 family endonuclease [Candidatus Cyanaurora vandensis]
MTTLALERLGEQRIVLTDVSWQTFQQLVKELPQQRNTRLAYAQGVLEFMSPLDLHEKIKDLLVILVRFWGLERDLVIEGLGSWTMRREDLEQGVEPDGCFYIQNAPLVIGRSPDLNQVPPPDLVIEVDITSPSTIRLPIYQALGVPEVWQWQGSPGELIVLHRTDEGYQRQDYSQVLVDFPVAQLTGLVQQSLQLGQSAVLRSFRDSLRRGALPASEVATNLLAMNQDVERDES